MNRIICSPVHWLPLPNCIWHLRLILIYDLVSIVVFLHQFETSILHRDSVKIYVLFSSMATCRICTTCYIYQSVIVVGEQRSWKLVTWLTNGLPKLAAVSLQKVQSSSSQLTHPSHPSSPFSSLSWLKNAMAPPEAGNFAGMAGAKRRRIRSGGTNNASKRDVDEDPDAVDDDEEKTVQTSKCKGATTIPIFLKSKLWMWIFGIAWILSSSSVVPE